MQQRLPNATLALPQGQTFVADNPTADIATVQVVQDAGNIRVSVAGNNALPQTEVTLKTGGLAYSLNPEGDEADDEIVVTGEGQRGYRVPNVSTATRTDTPIRDIPQSLQVIPSQVLQDQQVIQLQDALRNVSGVVQGNSFGNSGERYTIRGFETSAYIRNDFREDELYVRDPANIERIEVLRGPASVLYGTLEPGGVVSLVTKQPLTVPFYTAELQVGSFSFIRPSIDLSGPLNPDRTLLYRLNTVYQRANSFRDFDQGIERIFVAPVLKWQISDRIDLNLEFDYLNDERPFDRGLIAFGNRVIDVPFDRIRNEPDDVVKNERIGAGYRLEYRLSDQWTFRNGFRYSFLDSVNCRAERRQLNEATGNIGGEWLEQQESTNTYAIQTNFVGKFKTGSVSHTLLLGADFLRRVNDFNGYEGISAPTINIFNPIYRLASRPNRSDFPDLFTTTTTTDSLGIYLQDQIAFSEQVKLLIGGRIDLVDQSSSFEGTFGTGSSRQRDEAFSPRIGIVYQPIKPLSLYASYSRSFAPNSGTTAAGDILEPTRGTQFEVGVRGELLNERLLVNLAAYHLTKSNIATTDPNDPDFSIAVGEQRSQGIELDVLGEILPGWNIIASYAYTDAEIAKDNDLAVGNRLTNVPRHTASLWTTYTFQRGRLKGFGVGIGMFYVGDRVGDLANSFEVPSYLRTDASIFYRGRNWRVGVNVKNPFNVDYIESATFRAGINPSAPLTVLGTVSVDF